jgi:hypothetical protein
LEIANGFKDFLVPIVGNFTLEEEDLLEANGAFGVYIMSRRPFLSLVNQGWVFQP